MELDLDNALPIPLYVRLSEALKREVTRGALSPGDRLPSFSQLREQYGLHKNTIEQAHTLLENEGLVVRKPGRGVFVASTLPAHVPARRNQVLGFCGVQIMMSQQSPYWMKLLKGVWDGLSHGNADEKSDEERPFTHQLLLFDEYTPSMLKKVDGLLINAQLHENQYLELPPGSRCVSLLIANKVSDISSVVADDYGGAQLLTQHLLELGHRRIAFFYNRAGRIVGPQRLQGYRDALKAAGVKPRAHWVSGWNSEALIDFTQIAEEAMTRWIKRGWKDQHCTAIICQNDEAAIGVMRALGKEGYSVPEDVSVAGFDGTASKHLRPTLTTIELPLREIGNAAVELLIRPQSKVVEHLTLPTRLRIGGSTARFVDRRK